MQINCTQHCKRYTYRMERAAFRLLMNEGVVSKETVVLRRWGSSIPSLAVMLFVMYCLKVPHLLLVTNSQKCYSLAQFFLRLKGNIIGMTFLFSWKGKRKLRAPSCHKFAKISQFIVTRLSLLREVVRYQWLTALQEMK